jgi:hypothetical protein
LASVQGTARWPDSRAEPATLARPSGNIPVPWRVRGWSTSGCPAEGRPLDAAASLPPACRLDRPAGAPGTGEEPKAAPQPLLGGSVVLA